MGNFAVDENAPILVEFEIKPGLQQVSLSPADVVEKSAAALDSAMNTIHHMARRVTSTVDALAARPSLVEVSFGLKLEAEAGAFIAKAGAEASINVKLTWQGSSSKHE